MATIQINLQSTDAAKRDLTNTRQAIADINKQIAENTRAITRSDQAGQQKLRTQNQNLAAERGLLRSVRENTSIKLAGLRMEQQALQANIRAREQAARRQQQINRQEQAAAGRLFAARQNFLTNLSFILGTVNRQLIDLNANFIRSAANLETFGNTLRIAEGSAAAGADALDRLLQITIDLVGIDTSDLISFYSRLRLAGGAAEDVEVILRGATEAVAEQGKSVAVTRRILEQLTQAYQSQSIVYQDFRPILRELPTLYQDASRALGAQITDLESFRAAAENVGGARNAIVATFRAIEERSEGANLNTFNAQLEQVRDQLFVLSAEIGREVLPALTGFLRHVSGLVMSFRELSPTVKAVIGFSSLAAAGLTTLTVAASATVVAVGALNASLVTLTGVGGLAGLAAAFAGLLPFLGAAGLIAGGAIAAGYAIYRIADIANPGTLRVVASLTVAEQKLKDVGAQAVLTGEALQLVSQAEAQAIAAIPGAIQLDAPAFEAVRQQAEDTGRGIVIVPEDASGPIAQAENLSLSLAKAESSLRMYRDALGAAQNVAGSGLALRGVIAALEAEQRTREAIARETIEEAADLEVELFRIQDDFNRDSAAAAARHQQRIRTFAGQTLSFRIDAARQARDIEIAAFTAAAAAGQTYANTLRSITDTANRAAFQRLVDRLQDQGLSFQQALTEAQRYKDVISALSSTITAADSAYGQFNSTIGQTPTSQITRLLDGARQIGQFLDNRSGDLDARVAAGAASNQAREATVGGSDVLGELQQDARAQGVQFLIRQRDQQLQELARSAAQVERTIDGALSRIGGRLAETFVSVISDGTASLQDLGREFLAFSARILARTVIRDHTAEGTPT